MECKECAECRYFANGENNDYCTLKGRPAECYDFACDDFKE